MFCIDFSFYVFMVFHVIFNFQFSIVNLLGKQFLEIAFNKSLTIIIIIIKMSTQLQIRTLRIRTFPNADFRTPTAIHSAHRKLMLLFAQTKISYLKIARILENI